MVDLAPPTNPLIFTQPIIDPATGKPTEYFLRQWSLQRAINSTSEQIVEAINQLLETEVNGGTGIDGGGALGDGNITLDLADTAVTPGTYGSTGFTIQLTVDQQGRITAISERAEVEQFLPAFAGYRESTFTADQVVARYVATKAHSFPIGLTGSQGYLATAATGSTVFSIQKNGTQFGTMTFAASGTVASFAAASGASFVAGDLLSVVAPTSPDASAADLSFSIQTE